ncbi:3-carboxy-cis,cis-muconate cycloisomerase [Streptomyces sp. NBC_01754]|uniref:3-carboxy-cis,cis-muconate cycloisomerase n=1 Tax=Streptomyces sp. NBC_01754 TaxID=2975930 RepID=UPI002DDC5036|nr:3-carboxy-cis,cis-muconate cycloisomerase [Streptomyces sp. NBC_01754]WSC94040.1 3-carboxy-cis,cis-muconate cycloisomerase [Streptomyces sp. NBC_01754]
MTSAETSADSVADVGLLSPVQAGSAVEGLTGDAAYVRAMLDAEVALVRAQATLGLAPGHAADAVAAAAGLPGRFDARDLALRSRSGGNPVIPLVLDLTAAVREADQEAAAYVHRGATSQDVLDTATMLVASRALGPVLDDLGRVADALGRLAAEHRDTAMPGRTLTQHAVPTTFGLKAAGWRALVLDAHDRVATARSALPVQLGGAAGTLAAFAEEVDGAAPAEGGADPGVRLLAAYAAGTGLAEPVLPWHVLRTPVADLGGALAFTAGALGKLAADVLVLSRTEIGEVSEGTGGESSAMPHKANPARATLIAGAARRVPALAGILYGSLVAEDERPAGAWHAEWQTLRDALRTVGAAAATAAGLAEGLRVRPGRMRNNLDATHGLITTERLVSAYAPLAGRAEARAAVTRAGERAVREGAGLYASLLAEPVLMGLLPEERLRALVDPTGYPGSAGPLVDRALDRRPHSPPRPD